MHIVKKISKNKQGISIIEISVVIAIISVTLLSFMNFAVMSINNSNSHKLGRQAVLYAQEMIEATRNFRDNTEWAVNGLGTKTTGIALHPAVIQGATSTEWSLAAGEESIGPFTRSITLSPVSRNTVSGDIDLVYNSLNRDLETLKITATISWESKSLDIESYLSNWK